MCIIGPNKTSSQGIISSFEGYSNKTNCWLFFTSEYSSLCCLFDKDKISKILSNLLLNAFKYNNKQKREINVDLSFVENQIFISVKDNGQGIQEENLESIFKRYYQVQTSNTQPQGTGIGLAYVKELVELMDGSVTISSEVNIGTQVTITLPLADYKIADMAACNMEFKPDKKHIINNQTSDVLNKKVENENIHSILIVEDNYDLRFFLNKEMGKGFKTFVNEYRIEKAKELLIEDRNASVLSIAFEVGFKSKSSFNAVFRELTGMTPTIFRKENL